MLIRFIANLALSLAFSISLSAQVSKPETKADLGSLTFSRTHLRWPTPDSLVKDLRADDDQTRLQALALIGASPSGDMPGTPLEVELRYASLGSDAQQQAIVGVDLGPMLFGAVAVHENGVWHRIANFSCWCKYEFGDLVGDFIHVESGPENGLELVLRASGGGTGVYSQDEAHFRYYRGELHLVPRPFFCESFPSVRSDRSRTLYMPGRATLVLRKQLGFRSWRCLSRIAFQFLTQQRARGTAPRPRPRTQLCQNVFVQDLQMEQGEISLHRVQRSQPVQTSTVHAMKYA
jgi:hypothetical protein